MPVSWNTVWLQEPRELAFPNGQPFVLTVKSIDFDDLSVGFSNGVELVLPGVIESDGRFEWPRIHLFAGNDPGELFFFGGPAAYRVRSDGHIAEKLETHRDPADYSLDVVTQQDIAVIVYEVGILVIGDDLRPRWQKRKYMDTYEIAIEEGMLILRKPFIRPIVHRLSDGEVIAAPKDYSPRVGERSLPDERELIEHFFDVLDNTGMVRALSAICAEARKIVEQGGPDQKRVSRDQRGDRRAEELSDRITAQINVVKAGGPEFRVDQAFIDDLIARWLELDRDLISLLRTITRCVYA